MFLTLIALAIAGGVVFKLLTGGQREELTETTLSILHEVKHAARVRPEEAEFTDALKARVRVPIVTPALLALNGLVFLLMVFGAAPLGEPRTLIAWGASIGTRTSNAEWWRLLTSMFVHSGFVEVVLVSLGLAQVGIVLERLVGRVTLLAAYLAAGVFAGLAYLSAHPAAIGFGASGAVFGAYGLFAVFMVWSYISHSALQMPRPAVKKLVPAAALFALYSLTGGSLDATANMTGFMCGAFCGIVGLVGATDARPTPRRAAAAMAAALIFAVGSAIPLRGFADIAPELDRLVTVEDHAASTYAAADKKFLSRKITADRLADVIDQQIIPELETTQSRLQAIHKVPPEHQPMLDDALKFVQLRTESWRYRSKGLRNIELRDLQKTNGTEEATAWRRRADAQHRANLAMLGNADGKEHASLEVLQRIKKATFY